MATVVITFFLITQFHVFKMDVGLKERTRNISQREKRWSMNSQRLEEIVAELMKPISDVRRSFDTDLSALLEEYLTEAGLHALDAEEDDVTTVVPNFVELALLLQQSASIYSRKVDFLYQHVLNVSDSLQQSTQEAQDAGADACASARRKRKASADAGAFAPLQLTAGAARREGAARPPPTLPRMYVELEPRALTAGDAPLQDYAGEPIGLLPDFHVAWRLQEGFLVEELSGVRCGRAALRPLPLAELSAAIAAAAAVASPSAASPPPMSPPPISSQPASSTPLPLEKRERKRRSDVRAEDVLDGSVTLRINKEVRRKLQTAREFDVPQTWLRRVLSARSGAVLAARRRLRLAEPAELRGFDVSDSMDVGGFAGWSNSEVAEATQQAASARRPEDSDDDGFFEQSSSGDSDGSRVDDCSPAAGARAEWASWRERVVARAAEGEARGRDVRRAAAALLTAAEQLPPDAAFREHLAHTATHPAHVSELFLATLFLANAGNIDIIQGAPLSVDSFAVRLVCADPRLYRAALAPPAAPAHAPGS